MAKEDQITRADVLLGAVYQFNIVCKLLPVALSVGVCIAIAKIEVCPMATIFLYFEAAVKVRFSISFEIGTSIVPRFIAVRFSTNCLENRALIPSSNLFF